MLLAPDQVVEFLLTCGRLKTTRRTGWVESGVSQPESVSDHMHRMGVISLLIQSDHIDFNKCVQMSIVHDLAEAIVGDLTPTSGLSKADKHRMELQALNQMLAPLPALLRDRIARLWHEYEEAESAEAQIVKDIDKIEMLIQAYEYERDQGVDLTRFYESTVHRLRSDAIKDVARCLMGRRTSLTAPVPSSPS